MRATNRFRLSRLTAPLAALLLTACGSTPMMELELISEPPGANVSVSRRGEKTYQAKIAFVKGKVNGKDFEEDFRDVGMSPVDYVTPVEELETDATFLGVGGRVLVRYEEALVRFEKDGYVSAEKYVRLEPGSDRVSVVLQAATDASE